MAAQQPVLSPLINAYLIGQVPIDNISARWFGSGPDVTHEDSGLIRADYHVNDRMNILQPFSKKVAGISPESVALSSDFSKLYVACAGINAVGVVNLKGVHPRVSGFIPTGWYPDNIVASPNGKYIAVSTLLGVGTGWNSPNLLAREKRDGMKPELNIHRRYVHADRGTVHIIPIPDEDELERYSIAVAENNHMGLAGDLSVYGPARPNPNVAPRPVPARLGEPSTIDHVVYIIKENRSYDQYFGSLGKGNGDPSLNMYQDDVIPNQRKLAR